MRVMTYTSGRVEIQINAIPVQLGLLSPVVDAPQRAANSEISVFEKSITCYSAAGYAVDRNVQSLLSCR